jgi:hypothetical protein
VTTDDVHPDEMPDELDAFFDELRSAAASASPPVLGDALATLFRDGAAPQPAPSRRRRIALRAVAAGAAAGIAFGGLGVAGALPGPVQHRVADVVEHVGVHLPDDQPAPTTTTTTSTTVLPPPTVLRTPATVPTTVAPPAPRGEEPGRSGDDHGRSGEDHGRSGEDHGNGPGRDSGKHLGQEQPGPTTTTTAEDGSGHGGRGRNPHHDDDVRPDNSGPGSGHDDGSDG